MRARCDSFRVVTALTRRLVEESSSQGHTARPCAIGKDSGSNDRREKTSVTVTPLRSASIMEPMEVHLSSLDYTHDGRTRILA